MQYEYMITWPENLIARMDCGSGLEKAFNEAGSKGWELVSVALSHEGQSTYYFKRKLDKLSSQ